MKLNKRTAALILSVVMALSSPCTASAAVQNTEPIVIADSGFVLDSGKLPPEPGYYSAEYANLLAAWDARNAKAGKPTQLWMNYMVKWGKAIPYAATPDNYVYKPPNPKGRAATIPISSLPMGAKIADGNTKWYGEILIWIKISDDVLQPKDGENTVPTSITCQGTGSWETFSTVNNSKQLWVTEQSIARIPTNLTARYDYVGSDLEKWYTPGGGDPYEIFGFNFYDGVLSSDLKRYTAPSVPIAWCSATPKYSKDYITTYFAYAAPPTGSAVNYGASPNGKNGSHLFPYIGQLPAVSRRTTTHPVKVVPRLYFGHSCGECDWNPIAGIDWPGSVLCSTFIKFYDNASTTTYQENYRNDTGKNTYVNHNRCYEIEHGLHPSVDTRPTIALKGDAQVFSTADSNGVYTLVPSFTAPTTDKTINRTTNTATITGSSPAAATMEITGNGLSGQVSGNSISKATIKNGTYQVTARSGNASLSTSITITELDNSPPVISFTAL